MEFMFSEKGKRLIIYNGYKFYKDGGTTLKGVKWRCVKKACRAKIYTDDPASVILDSDVNHNHAAEENLPRQIISNSVKRKAVDDIAELPRKLIRKEVTNSTCCRGLNANDIDNIRKNMYNARRRMVSSQPKSISDVHEILADMCIKSNRNESMIQINDSAKNIVCFSTEENLKYFCSTDKFFVDGTFSYCPKYFFQLFVLHTVENGHYIPLVFFLLPDKATETYEHVFRLLKAKCVSYKLNLEPKTVVADFEKAIHIAVQKVWPTCSIVGCRFHLTQAWFRNLQTNGLTGEYKNKDSITGQWLRWLFGLPFLNPEEVSDAFVEDFMSEMPNDCRVVTFVDYLTDNYISEESKFPPFIWASPTMTSERTTNACESFHSKFNSTFYASHPNIYIFIEALKQIQVDVYISLNSVCNEKKITNRKYKQRIENFEGYLKKYREHSISRFHFIKCVSYNYKKSI